MTRNSDQHSSDASVTRRGVLQAGGAAVAAALPAGMATSAQPVGPVMAALSTYMSEARDRALPADVVEKTKHHVLDTFAAMISGAELAAGPRRDPLRARLWRRAGRDGRGLGRAVRPDRGGARQRRAGARRRDRRFARPFALASGLRGRAGGARGRRAVRHRRHAFRARGRARLRHRPARHHVPRRSGALARGAQEQPQHRRRVRRGGGRRLRGQPRRAADALAPRLHRAAVLRHRRLATRQRPHREGVRVRRHAGAQRGHVRAARALRMDRRRRHPVGAGQFHPGQRAQRRSGAARSRSSASATRSSAPTSRNGRSARRSRRRSTRWRSC